MFPWGPSPFLLLSPHSDPSSDVACSKKLPRPACEDRPTTLYLSPCITVLREPITSCLSLSFSIYRFALIICCSPADYQVPLGQGLYFAGSPLQPQCREQCNSLSAEKTNTYVSQGAGESLHLLAQPLKIYSMRNKIP